ncbi:MAG: hypothetical protein ACO1N0_13985 [Fluviicola sp.]
MYEHLESKIPNNNLRDLQPGEQKLIDTLDKSSLAKWLYDSRISAYKADSADLVRTLDFMTITMLLGIFILFYRPHEIEIPIVRIKLPDKLFYLVIPIVVLYLFFQLGLVMNATIDTRIILEIMTDHIETIDSKRVSYYYSNARTLVDQGLVDSWCTWYYDIFEGGRNGHLHQNNAKVMLFGFFGSLWGLSQAICLNLISSYYRTYKRLYLCGPLMLFSAFLFFGWAHNTLAWYPYCADLLCWIWGIATAGVGLWGIYTWFSPPQEIVPESK